MTDEATRPRRGEIRREVGHAGGHTPGPTVIVTAGIHGNEPSGLAALDRVFRKIEADRLTLRGEIVGLAGNLEALATGDRFLTRDLNRAWTFEEIAESRRPDAAIDAGPEERQRRELLEVLERWIAEARGNVVILDLHTTSSRSAPFLVYSDTLRNRDFARTFPIPGILGVEEKLGGTLIDYFTTLGHVAIVIEGGGHGDLASIESHEAAIWLGLVRAGALDAAEVPGFARYRDRLREAGRGVPPVLETFYRHEVAPDDEFRMVAGFRNLEKVAKGTLLATDRNGEIRAPVTTRLFMPLYQPLGSDGFFFTRRVNRAWLWLSEILRKLRVGHLAPLLPGVKRHPDIPRTLVVDRNVARWFAPQIFHLLGFRISRPTDRELVVHHRRVD